MQSIRKQLFKPLVSLVQMKKPCLFQQQKQKKREMKKQKEVCCSFKCKPNIWTEKFHTNQNF